jgi:Kdo2-lipid IVA lauroyltransferase/acyltransferase
MPVEQANRFRQLFKWTPMRRLRHVVEYTALTVVAWTIPKLPRSLVLALSRGLAGVAIRIDRRGRELGLENLRVAIQHGGLDLGDRTPEEVLAACYENFARSFLDLFWFSRLTADQLDRWVDIEDEERVRQMLSTDRGAIFLTPHYGIFEWSSLIIGFRGLKLDIIAQDFKNPALTQIVRRAREHSGHQVLSRDGGMLKLLRSVKRGGNIALLPDLTVPPQSAATVVNVFGIPACMTAAHVEIARRCDALMFVAICEPIADGRARLKVLDVISATGQGSGGETQAQVAQRVWDHFESAIRQRPELWLWMYRHWRYRPLSEQRAEGDDQADADLVAYKYPCYSLPVEAFDSLYRKQAG